MCCYCLACFRELSSFCGMSSCSWSAYPAGSAVGSKTGPPQISCSMLTHFKGKICFEDAVGAGVLAIWWQLSPWERMQNPPVCSKEHFSHILKLKFDLHFDGLGRRRNRMSDKPNFSLPQPPPSLPITSPTSHIAFVHVKCVGGLPVDTWATQVYRVIYSSWSMDAGMYCRTCHTNWLYSSTQICEQPRQNGNNLWGNRAAQPGYYRNLLHVLAVWALLRPNSCCWAFLETLSTISVIPLMRNTFSASSSVCSCRVSCRLGSGW